ncbi:DNA repair protein (Rad57) [Cordyceps javanica]|uniref:DNA repair protein (Rad57) n=1 Tax=Cordyceps javanica TaxID=43265 RepID=A0A545W1L5_9HYPO|nr:DNA repair protein (Rad57) [Cordyceps javanica]TQW07850.1 DNA repair protein (Rad57) [Cordyceps javanica]
MPRSSPLAPLRCIGDDVYLYEPSGPPDPSYRGPSLIVLSTWLGGATAKNVGHYVAGHRALFRDAAVLLITARLSEITVTPFTRMHARLQPARDVIVRHVLAGSASSPSPPSIMWHIFSNGGLNMAIQLARITRSALEATGRAADLDRATRAVVMDCCPGDGSLGRTFRAAAYSLPNTWVAQTVGRLLLFPTIAVLLGVQNSGVLGRGGSLADLYRGAHDPAVFGRGARRMYLYSVSDRLVPWRVVHRHMAEARDKGFVVDGEAIPGGSHCALLRADAARYWRAVERCWDELEERRGAARPSDAAGARGRRKGDEEKVTGTFV